MLSSPISTPLRGGLLAAMLLVPLGDCTWSFSSNNSKKKNSNRPAATGRGSDRPGPRVDSIEVQWRPVSLAEFCSVLDWVPNRGPGFRIDPAGLVAACRSAEAELVIVPGCPLIRSLWMPARLRRFERAVERWEQRGALVRVPGLLSAWLPGFDLSDPPKGEVGDSRRLILGNRAFVRLCREPQRIAARIARIRARS